ncbi:hypothetical protein [Rhizobium sp. 007]|uniref:hypothetical protein n=1 Tax=Rhizobium sp. 007 TaxID=2785056 RepID=UPI00188FCE3D|nr:hypothetical protein [Rhizobium sp. 007]QPB24333.1 hypothetical protein ISN39_32780 [Rhizobium sp. 007]
MTSPVSALPLTSAIYLVRRLERGDLARDIYKRSASINRIDARERAFAAMWDYEAKGFVVNSPGSRGGAGWALSMKGAALIKECMRG